MRATPQLPDDLAARVTAQDASRSLGATVRAADQRSDLESGRVDGISVDRFEPGFIYDTHVFGRSDPARVHAHHGRVVKVNQVAKGRALASLKRNISTRWTSLIIVADLEET
jgi:hypothetical protein